MGLAVDVGLRRLMPASRELNSWSRPYSVCGPHENQSPNQGANPGGALARCHKVRSLQ
jgi:hypothetical protein